MLISSPCNFLNLKRGGWNYSELQLFIPTQEPAGPWLCPDRSCQPRQGFQSKVRLTRIPWCLCWHRVHPGEFFPLLSFPPPFATNSEQLSMLESTPDCPAQMTWFSLQLEDADFLNAFGKQTVLSKYTHWVFIDLQYTSLKNTGFLPWLKAGLMRRNICQCGDSVVLAVWQASQQSNRIQKLKLGRTLGIKFVYS